MKNTLLTLIFISLLTQGFGQNFYSNPKTELTTTSWSKDSTKLKIHFAPRQNKKHTFPRRFWLDISGQGGLMSDKNTLATGAGVNLHYLNRDHRHFQLRYNYVQELPLFGSNIDYVIHDAGYMFGWLHARKYFMMEFALGVGFVHGYNRGNEKFDDYWSTTYAKNYFASVGLPVEADIKFMCKRYAGLGLVLKGNLNPKLSYAVIGVELTLNGPN